ncbi:sugar translocase [Tersicoccus solisilvae]|uniref:dolichyl-phosphate beta-glucosyltransferase n=1 Tax=Tersicoccus solisilvae TaxID=1882339 RepID=A0ABQ1PK47_9MICC|nr:bifunctional glycosyltransferase family 2/GtrA family protein [Tersicoccus solisilvae]GGC98662.1 sugar translocase [Tersicoccus solisilvae]
MTAPITAPLLVAGVATDPPTVAPRLRRGPVDTAGPVPVLDVTIPVYNEEKDIEATLRRLHRHLTDHFPHRFAITVADNASTDGTLPVAERVARELPEVRVVHLEEKGRGRALRRVWSDSPSPVLAYMDVDLSTDLAALGPLVAPLISGHSDVAIGTRLARGSRVVRGAKREFISRSYNLLLRSSLGARFSDAQCGFKAIRGDVAQMLLPYTEDNAWFFDTELLVLAERSGLRIAEVPVDWTDDPDSSVDIVRTALDDVRGIVRISRDLVRGRIPVEQLRTAVGRGTIPGQTSALFTQVVRFGVVGVASTLAYLAIFTACRLGMDPQAANLVALLTTAIGNTAANRIFTFGVSGSTGALRHHAQGLIVFGIGLALTSGALAAVHAAGSPGRTVELAAVVGANLLATLVRFLLFRLWVFRPRFPASADGPATTLTPAPTSMKDSHR